MLAHPKRGRRGFTLVEMLVVVVVICLLAGALFAVLRSAKEAAARTTCINHLHQLVAAMDLYRQQYGAYPPWGYGGIRSTGEFDLITWEDLLLPYVGSEEVFLCPTDAARGDEPPHSYEYPQGPLHEPRRQQSREDPEQEALRKATLKRARAAARHHILLDCPHHEQEPPVRRLLAQEDGSVTWEPLPEGM